MVVWCGLVVSGYMSAAHRSVNHMYAATQTATTSNLIANRHLALTEVVGLLGSVRTGSDRRALFARDVGADAVPGGAMPAKVGRFDLSSAGFH